MPKGVSASLPTICRMVWLFLRRLLALLHPGPATGAVHSYRRECARLLIGVAIVALGGPVWAQDLPSRTFPQDAKKGRLSHLSGQAVTLDGRAAQLSGGAQIRSDRNLIIVPSALPREAIVRYQLDEQGHVHRAWVLSKTEAQ